jgi:hypothetical protein
MSVILSPLAPRHFYEEKNKTIFPFGLKFTSTVGEGKFGVVASLYSQESILFSG